MKEWLRSGFIALFFFGCLQLNAQIERLDSTFNSSGVATINFSGSTDQPAASAVQPDGKIVIFGNSSGVKIARYNSDGSPDSTFGIDGKVLTLYGETIGIADVKFQADGKIVAGGIIGYDFAVLRFNPNGTLDSSFGMNGIAAISFNKYNYALSIVLQPDGKIVIGGYTTKGTSETFAIARLNENGSLDPSFGVDGKVEASISDNSHNYCNAVALQSDGKILAAGITYSKNFGKNVFALIRFKSNGMVDSSFNKSGYIIDSIYEDFDQNSILVNNDSALKIITVICNGKGFITSQYNEDGSIDSSFGRNGIDTTVITDSVLDYVGLTSTALQTDGNIFIGGIHLVYANQGFYPVAIRLNPQGILDTSFGEQGEVSVDSDRIISSVLQINQRIIVIGSSEFGSNGWDFSLKGYKMNAMLDSSFGNEGITHTNFGNGNDYGEAIVVQDDGKMVAVGYSALPYIETENYIICDVARMNSDGSLDSSFNSTGKISFEGQSATGEVIQPDGKILVGGTNSNSEMAVARLNSNGTIDSSFGNHGSASHNTGYLSLGPSTMALQSDGKILTAGMSSLLYFLVHRFNADGSDDYSFGDSSDANFGSGQCESLIVESDGKILAAGIDLYSHFIVKKIDSDGTIDSSYGDHGTATISAYNLANPFIGRSMALQTDGKLLFTVYNEKNYYNKLIRLNTDGSRDLSFGDSGSVLTNTQNIYVNGEAVLLQPDNKILVAGYSGNEEDFTQAAFAMMRFNADGSPDLTFGNGGIIINNINGYYAQCFAGALQSDDKILLAGYSFNGNDDDFAIVRYLNALATGLIDYTSPSVMVSYVYPNPVHSGAITLQYELPSEENISLSLLDSYGREVMNYFTNKESSAGKHTEELIIPDHCPSAFYLLFLKTEHGNVSIRLDKQ